MAIMKSVRRLFSKREPLELSVSQSPDQGSDSSSVVLEPSVPPSNTEQPHTDLIPTEPLEAMNTLNRIEESMRESGVTHTAMLTALEQLPELTRHASTASERHIELNELMRGLASAQHESGIAQRETTEHMSQCLDRHNEMLGLVQRQLDANHQIATHTAEHLSSLSETLQKSMAIQQKTGEAMCTMADQFRTREETISKRFSRIQGWLIACIIASIGTVIAAVTLAWILFGANAG